MIPIEYFSFDFTRRFPSRSLLKAKKSPLRATEFGETLRFENGEARRPPSIPSVEHPLAPALPRPISERYSTLLEHLTCEHELNLDLQHEPPLDMAHQIEDKDMSDEEQYDENADEDFNPEAANCEESAASSSDNEESAPQTTAKPPAKGRKKRKSEAIGDLDSGDEATIQERETKKRKKESVAAEDEESGGEGGLIKTRAQRLAEKVERKQRKRGLREGDVTIDVDEVWAALKAIPVGRPPEVAPEPTALDEDGEENKENVDTEAQDGAEEFITIKRRIEYAGEVTEVEERVPKSSNEARRYLAEHAQDPHKDNTASAETRRPLKRPSLFEPNPTALVKGVPPEKLRPRAPNRVDVLMAEKRAEEERQKKAEKMTTVQKSALDWRGFVAKEEGLREELDEYGKSKGAFLGREEFLGRAQFAREMAGREARLKG